MLYFSTGRVTFRQLLAWGFFGRRYGKEVDREWFDSVFEQFKMKELYGIFNAICVEDLGFDASLFNGVQFDSVTKEKVLNDIYEPAFDASAPKQLIRRLIYKYCRWRGNAWKHKLCYDESLWSAFWYGVWAKIQKPATI